MNKILIAGETDDIANITVNEKKYVEIIYHSGGIVRYLYNPHLDKDKFGKTQWEKDRDLEVEAVEFHERIKEKGWT